MGCLYRLTSPTGKQYIGITLKTAENRFVRHAKQSKNGRACAISAAIRKYGPESFVVETLVIADDTDYLRSLERSAIVKFKTLSPRGYNLSGGGEKSEFWSQESLARVKEGMRRSWASPSDLRLATIHVGVKAMRAALDDPEKEKARRAKISATMRGTNRGEANAASKISEQDAIAIKRSWAAGEKPTAIAERHGVSRSLVDMIGNGKRWAHI